MSSSASQDIDVVKVDNIEKKTFDYCQKEKIENRSSVKACYEKRWADDSFSDKRNHTAYLCNIYLFRLEFQYENRLKFIKSWHKTSADLFDFHIQNREYSLYNDLSILAHEFSNINLETSFWWTQRRTTSIEEQRSLICRSQISVEDIHLQYLSNRSIRERVLMSISNVMQSELVVSLHNQHTWLRQHFRVFKMNRRNSMIAKTSRQVEWDFSLDAMLIRNSDSMSWAVKMKHDWCRVIQTANEKRVSVFYSQNSDLSQLTMLISKIYWRRIAS